MDREDILVKEKLRDMSNYQSFDDNNLAMPADNTEEKTLPKYIEDYTTWTLIVVLGLIALSAIPIVTISAIAIPYGLFSKIWWLSIGSLTFILVISILAFIYNKQILQRQDSLPYYIFAIYTLMILSLAVGLVFFNSHLAIGIIIMLSVSITFIIISNKINSLKDKHWIKLSMIYSFILLFMVGYIIISNQRYVELFVITILVVFYIAYLTIQLQFLYKEFSKDGLIDEKVINIKAILMGLIVANIDLLVFTFK